jgi:hypothetical protein
MRPTPPSQEQERKPGRSFEDPRKPLGDALLERSGPSDTHAREDFRSREAQADMPHKGISERAKVVAVLRKADELICDANPPCHDEASLRRAVELAAGRVGLTIQEYHALVRGDAELEALERQVLDAARAKF